MSLLALGAIDVAGYQARTGDTTTESAAVESALEDAETQVAQALRRTVDGVSALADGDYTARLRIHPDGRVFPPAYPVTASGDLTLENTRTILGATPDGGPFVTFGTSSPPKPYATITWTGGYTAASLPVALRNAIYDLAQAIAVSLAPIAVGATSMSVGDVSVSYSTGITGDLDALVPGLTRRLSMYRNTLGDGMA